MSELVTHTASQLTGKIQENFAFLANMASFTQRYPHNLSALVVIFSKTGTGHMKTDSACIARL